jgi:hypothetical protein
LTFIELENLLVSVFSSDQDLVIQLSNDPDYLEEDRLIKRLAEEISLRGIAPETLASVDSKNWIQRTDIAEIPNIYDFVIQATLASSGTPLSIIELLLAKNPNWLSNGWWCAYRLLQNPNIDSALVSRCVEALIEMDEFEFLELAANHPNVSDETQSQIEALE